MSIKVCVSFYTILQHACNYTHIALRANVYTKKMSIIHEKSHVPTYSLLNSNNFTILDRFAPMFYNFNFLIKDRNFELLLIEPRKGILYE